MGKSMWFEIEINGGKVDNMFIDEFGSNIDKARALNNSPWMVGKHAVILQEYDEALKPYDVCFVRMEMWVSILNLPFSWMNERRGRRAAGLISEVMKMMWIMMVKQVVCSYGLELLWRLRSHCAVE
jgi:hypothetical protein